MDNQLAFNRLYRAWVALCETTFAMRQCSLLGSSNVIFLGQLADRLSVLQIVHLSSTRESWMDELETCVESDDERVYTMR